MRIGALLVLVVGCSGTNGTMFDATGDGGTPGDAAPNDARAADGGIAPAGVYGHCGAPKALNAGSSTELKAKVTMRWPSPWVAADAASNTIDAQEPYMYVPTGATAPVQSYARVTLWDDTVATDEIDATKRMNDMVNGVPASQTTRFTLGGHAAIMWWTQEPPPQPGCFNCPGDPGPDIVTISLVIDDDRRLVQLTGAARVNAPADVFCDIQAIELGVTF